MGIRCMDLELINVRSKMEQGVQDSMCDCDQYDAPSFCYQIDHSRRYEAPWWVGNALVAAVNVSRFSNPLSWLP